MKRYKTRLSFLIIIPLFLLAFTSCGEKTQSKKDEPIPLSVGYTISAKGFKQTKTEDWVLFKKDKKTINLKVINGGIYGDKEGLFDLVKELRLIDAKIGSDDTSTNITEINENLYMKNWGYYYLNNRFRLYFIISENNKFIRDDNLAKLLLKNINYKKLKIATKKVSQSGYSFYVANDSKKNTFNNGVRYVSSLFAVSFCKSKKIDSVTLKNMTGINGMYYSPEVKNGEFQSTFVAGTETFFVKGIIDKKAILLVYGSSDNAEIVEDIFKKEIKWA
ncbi:MAG: hypothetical protein LBD41_02620 [Clostridiales Family XIII bacterium]|jgi:hypothetical protein|nr:hypothetical protein [Clostridiales Family XIII bacterium]